MKTETVLIIIFIAIVALLLALFQYKFKVKSISKKQMLFTFLRFLSVFGILLLIINPKFKQTSYFIEKPKLSVVLDNSSSIKYLNQADKSIKIKEQLLNNSELAQKFNIDFYTFDDQLINSDTLSLAGTQTNISKALNSLKEINNGIIAPVVLITDGNQTYGNDYEFSLKNYDQPVYPIILGDTTKHVDLKIQQLNVNRYSYLKNKFPVEVILSYSGVAPVKSRFVISSGNKTLYSENVSFSMNENSKIIHAQISTRTIGVKKYKVEIIPLVDEKNKINNSRQFAVEVIDQKTNIAIISDVLHPDVGVLKKTIESNEQRQVKIFKPNEVNSKILDFELIIMYQPNNRFRSVFKEVKELNKNFLIITGVKTDWRFLNSIQNNFNKEISSGIEDVQAIFNDNFSAFITRDIDFSSFPPLKTKFGDITFAIKNDVLLNSKIGTVETNSPILTTFEENKSRRALLLGENIWKWRAQSYLNNKSFKEFDSFIGKLIQYLASSKKRDRLNINFESFYYGHDNIKISAEFFDKNYVFNPNTSLEITLKDVKANKTVKYPMLLKNNYYEIDLSSSPASEYEFIIRPTTENISKSGSFSILEFEVEKQFLNADVTKLEQLATNTKGKSYFVDNSEHLLNDLINDKRFTPIQKSKENIVPLIDWKWLLAIIAFTLSTEWFLRKYNGLI